MTSDAELYLKKHHIMAYIEDAVTFLLEKKDEDSKTKPYEVLGEYFESIKKGTHILFRDYSFITLTPHNRASFIQCFWNTYSEMAVKVNLMKVTEYLSLIRLLCHNFPSDVILKVGRVIFSFDITESTVSFPDFLYTFQTVFYYESFLERCECASREIASGQTPFDALSSGSAMVVSVPSAEYNFCSDRQETASSMHSAASSYRLTNSLSETEVKLNVNLFTKAVRGLCMKFEKEPWESCPSMSILMEVIGELTCVTFYNFVLALSRSGHLNCEIGVLPERSELLIGSMSDSSASMLSISQQQINDE